MQTQEQIEPKTLPHLPRIVEHRTPLAAQTANSTVEGPFVENIGPWFQVKAIGTSAHGDVAHTKGVSLAEGNPEVMVVMVIVV